MTSVIVSFEPHWINGWWLRAFTDPYVELDGMVTQCSWSTASTIDTVAGTHQLRTFVRYRRLLPGDGSSCHTAIEVQDGDDLEIVSSNGIVNNSPFVPRPGR